MFRHSRGATLAAVAVLAALLAGTPAAGADPPPAASDVFVVGTANTPAGPDHPVLFRVSRDGTVVWERSLPFHRFHLWDQNASRNVTEDALYLWTSLYNWNLVDGEGRVQKYDAWGTLEWELPVPTGSHHVGVYASPAEGGVYLATLEGVYRVAGDGTVLWGPERFGIGPGSGFGVAPDPAGGLYVSHYATGTVMKVGADGAELWRRTGYLPYRAGDLLALPGGGVYAMGGGYGNNPVTMKLDPAGDLEWHRVDYPSAYTYGRTVSPLDGSLYIVSGWAPWLARLSPANAELLKVSLQFPPGRNLAGWGIAAVLDEDAAYTADGYLDLGISKIDGATGARIWHVAAADLPGHYVYGSGYGPAYRIFTGLPAANAAPDCSAAQASVTVLWPPNHRLVAVEVVGVTDSDGDPVVVAIDSIHQDEPIDAAEDGAFIPDGVVLGTAVELRAERAGDGNGRVYRVSFTATDGRGGACPGVVTVGVPLEARGVAVDDGAAYDSTG